MTDARLVAFRKWLETRIAARESGRRLPNGTALAKAWGISSKTVGRVLKPYAEDGSLVRIRGKGTFFGPLSKLQDRVPEAPEGSAQRLAHSLRRSLGKGSLHVGDALPSVKYVARQFKVGERTVIKAYRILRNQGLVEKVGKSFYLGPVDAPPLRRRSSTVVLIVDHADPAKEVFARDPYAPVYRGLEMELRIRGHGLRLATRAEFERSRSLREADGLLLWRLDGKAALEAGSWLDRFARNARAGGKGRPVLLDCFGSARRPSRGILTLSRARIQRYMARHLIRHLLTTGQCGARVWSLREAERFQLAAFAGEVTITEPEFALVEETHAGPFSGTRGRSRLHALLDKAHAEGGPGLWLCGSDVSAARILDWARLRGIAVPGNLKLMAFLGPHDRDPRHPYGLEALRHGITTVDPDWESLGRLLAHHFIGDFKVERSKARGFVHYGGRIIRRETT